MKCAKRSSHLVSRALYVLLDRLRLNIGSNAWWSVSNFIGLPFTYERKCSSPLSQAAACDGTTVTTSAVGQEYVPGTLPIY